MGLSAVDVHAHFVPTAYRDAMAKAGIDRPDGFLHVPAWDVATTLAVMDEIGIAAQLLSISSPGVHFVTGAAARLLARQVNEDGATVVANRPDRFGLLATLPLPDIDAALEEITYASDVLGADGYVLMTNYAGVYLGDPWLQEVMKELDRRHAVVALHPTSPPGWEAVTQGRPRPMMEFVFDTTRAVMDLVLSGTLTRCPDIRVIVPHVGSALPSLVDRVQTFASLFLVDDEEPFDLAAQLGRLYYDLTGPALPHALPALMSLADPARVLYGSDLPFPPPASVKDQAEALLATELLDAATRAAIFTSNVAALFPRLGGVVPSRR